MSNGQRWRVRRRLRGNEGREAVYQFDLIAHDVVADSEQIEHLYAAVGEHLPPRGPVASLIDPSAPRSQPTIRAGAKQLLTWAKPWALTA